jgi:hypothetical protein
VIQPSDLLITARAQALFTSHLSAGSRPSPDDVHAAIRHAIRVHGGVRNCAAQVAGEYGDHPETAVRRMRWALSIARGFHARPTPSLRSALIGAGR